MLDELQQKLNDIIILLEPVFTENKKNMLYW